jgi:hypothetical protein
MALVDVAQKGVNGVGGGPCAVHVFLVGKELIISDAAIAIVEMHQNDEH